MAKFDPSVFSINLTVDEFYDQMVDEFNSLFKGISLDELLLHPREALRFCDEVRRKHGYYGLPDDRILRGVMHRRKNP